MRQALCSLLLVPVLGSAALASDTRYAVVAFSNPTSRTIHYQFRWGNGEWKNYSVSAGNVRSHSWTYDYVNQNHSPAPAIRFEAALRNNETDIKSYEVDAYAAPHSGEEFAKNYKFFTFDDETMLGLVGTD